MPRVRPKGILERNALSDLWKHTLSSIPSTYGKLVCLASLRDPNSGRYRHYGLGTAFGREQSALALQQSHEQVFREWLKMALEQKDADLKQYLEELTEPQALVAANWLRGGYYETLPPDRASRPQRAQFRQELKALLELIQNAAASGASLPGSKQSV